MAVIWLDQFKRDRLVPELAAELQECGSVIRRIEHVDDVDVWRQAARRAGRLLGWRVRSGISGSAAGDAVWVTSDDFEVTDADLRELGRRVSARLVNELRQLGRLSGWLAVWGTSAADLSVERVDEFLAEQRARGSRASWSRPGSSLHGGGPAVPRCGGVRASRAGGFSGGAVVGILRALLVCRAWPGAGHGPRVCGPCSAILGQPRWGGRARLGEALGACPRHGVL